MNENNNMEIIVENSQNSNNNGGVVPENSDNTKKTGFILLAVAVLLAMCSDLIPLPIDDFIAVALSMISGTKLFKK